MSLTQEPTKALELFYSYAHTDERWCKRLDTHLRNLQRQGFIVAWYDRNITAGTTWVNEIDSHLNTADIILLLISPDFIASDYCYSIEMKRAMERHQAGEARVIPVILRPTDWEGTPFKQLQALPTDGKAVTRWQNRDEAFFDIAQGVRRAAEEFRAKSHTTHTTVSDKHSIVSFPPVTDPKIILQREEVVRAIYAKLTQPDISALVLTGIGGLGKSTLAALLYYYAEKQRVAGSGLFSSEPLWLTLDSAVTLVDLATSLFEALGTPFPDMRQMTPASQALVLFNTLKTLEKPRIIILDQFENWLDWQTGYALSNHPGIGEWLDLLNGQQAPCRFLLTSRPWPQGTHEFPPTYMLEYAVQGLGIVEGAALLRKQGVKVAQGTDSEVRQAVVRCEGHPLALTLLAAILRRNQSLSLSLLFNNPLYTPLWSGDIARSLLDFIYTHQLSEPQRKLLQAFSIFREAVTLDAAQSFIEKVPKAQILPALNVLLAQHLLNAVGDGCYQLHAIVESYAQDHFVVGDEQANQRALQAMHVKAAQYYLQEAAKLCPPPNKRQGVHDVHLLIEAVWHLCMAQQWQKAYELMEKEEIFADLLQWGNNTILLELCKMLLVYADLGLSEHQHANVNYYIGETYRALGQPDLAENHTQEALALYQELKDTQGEGLALNGLGRIYNALWQKDRALEYYRRALSIYEERENLGGEAQVLNNLGRVYLDVGNPLQARTCFENALSKSREVSDYNAEGRALHGLGMVCRQFVETLEAQKYFEEALSVLRRVGDRAEEGKILTDLGILDQDLGRLEEALHHSLQALNIHREVCARYSPINR